MNREYQKALQASITEFSKTHNVADCSANFIYNYAYKQGYKEAEITKTEYYPNSYIGVDLSPRQWPTALPGERIEMRWFIRDIETLKKYVKLLVEWKNASNP